MAIVGMQRTNAEWLTYLGEQVRQQRLREGWDQEALAQRAGISVGALKNLESGKGSTLMSLIKVVRTLHREDWLQALSPRISVSPMLMLKSLHLKKPRQRVYKPRKKRIAGNQG